MKKLPGGKVQEQGGVCHDILTTLVEQENDKLQKMSRMLSMHCAFT